VNARGRRLDESSLAHLVGYAASRAALELRKVFARHMDALHLRVPEFSILMLVAANGAVNQKQLGEALDISPPNMAVTLDRMVEQGWVERVRGTHDRRAQHIHLTPLGRALAERSHAISLTMEEPALAALSRAERALLIELLGKIARQPAPAEATSATSATPAAPLADGPAPVRA
jgi:DNA-binding MarR family transcriptional regulator